MLKEEGMGQQEQQEMRQQNEEDLGWESYQDMEEVLGWFYCHFLELKNNNLLRYLISIPFKNLRCDLSLVDMQEALSPQFVGPLTTDVLPLPFILQPPFMTGMSSFR